MSKVYQIEMTAKDVKGKKVNRYFEDVSASRGVAAEDAVRYVNKIFGDSDVCVTKVGVVGKIERKKDKSKDRDKDRNYRNERDDEYEN